MSQMELRPPDTGLPVASLLVPLDGSVFAERAVAPAARIAARLGAPLHLWSAVSTPAEADGRRSLIRRLADDHGASWEVAVTDRPVDAIAAWEDGTGHPLICLATHGHDRTAAVTHSMSAAVVAASHGPVLLVGPAVPPDTVPRRTLAVCIDGSPDSDRVLATGVAWASALGLDVTVLTVAEPVPESIRQPGYYPRLHGPHGNADAYVQALAATWSGDVAVSGRVLYDPVDVDGALIGAFVADPPELVVMGTRAPRGLRRLILGSTAAAVAHGSRAPVLVIPLAS